VLRKSRVKFDEKIAGEFYREHFGKFYYNRLVTFMTRYDRI
jgi:nucleoside diphosphate kinase